MKITIKALIFLSVLAVSFSLKIERVEKLKRKVNAVKSKTKADNGEGSWNEGFRIPGFLVVTGNEGFNDDEKNRKGFLLSAHRISNSTMIMTNLDLLL